jgi:hypothetical protein
MIFDYFEYTLDGNQFDSYLSNEGTKVSLQGDILIMIVNDRNKIIMKSKFSKHVTLI